MASIRKRANGRWQAEVYKAGLRKGGTFDTKRIAQEWAARTEVELQRLAEQGLNGKSDGEKRTFGDMLERYEREVSPSKRGARWEIIRLQKLQRDPLSDKLLIDVGPPEIADWRDRRLAEVSPASVLREMNLIVAVCNRALKEWQWFDANPCNGVQRPKEPPPRERRISDAEIAAITHAGGWSLEDQGQIAQTATQRTMAAMLWAIETGMRLSEICGLRPLDIDRKARVAKLDMTKNGYGRMVPLSTAALAILDRLPKGADPVFGLKPMTLEQMFRKSRDKAMVDGLHFHDTRHEAVSRLAKKMDVLDLARMIGHRDIRMLMRYYHRDASDLAQQLD